MFTSSRCISTSSTNPLTGDKRGDFPGAEEAYSRCLSLPIFPDMSPAEIDRVVRSVSEIVYRNRKPLSVAA